MPWLFDPGHSHVEWSARYLGIGVIRGFFTAVSADIDLDGPRAVDWRVTARIDANSLTSGHDRRDGQLKGERYLDTGRFPTIEFRSTAIQGDGEQFQVTGDLDLHGVTRPVTLDVVYGGQAIDARGNLRRGFRATFVVSRRQFGIAQPPLVDPALIEASDDIAITIDAQVMEKTS